MIRRPPLEIAVVALLAAVWVGALTLHLDLVFRGDLYWVPVYVEPAETATTHPRVRGFWPETTVGDEGLRVGDALRSTGGLSLAGASRLDVLRRIHEARSGGDIAGFEVERDGRTQRATLTLRAFNAPWAQVPLVIGLGLGAFVIWFRRGASSAARACALAMTAYSLHWAIFMPAGGWRTVVGFWLMVGTGSLFGALALRAVILFPERASPAPKALRAAPWTFVLMGPLLASWQIGAPIDGPLGLRVLLAFNVGLIVALLGALAHTYLRAGVVARRQLRWVVLGLYVGLAPVAAAAFLGAVRPAFRPAYEWSLLATLAIPLAVTLALCRYNLYDIDRLITTAGAHTLVLIAGLAVVLAPLPAASAAVSELAEIQPFVAQVLFALVLATALTLGQRYLRPPLERLLFSGRHTFEAGVRELRTSLGRFEGPSAMLDAVAVRLSEMLDLHTCAIYARAGEAFPAVSAHGPAIPASFDAMSPLVAMLEEANAPVDDIRWRRWAGRGLIDDLDRAQLEGLDARLVVPFAGEKEIAGFICLSPKGNEDVYTPVDTALLELLADRMSAELERFGKDEILRAERAKSERLAGYVPEPVRDAVLARPIEVEPGEREVSMLFVDIRGYTRLSEKRTPDEIFRVINAYTKAVSRVIGAHGGFVVEFQGDGLMAVFGAPRSLEDKERAVVDCGLSIVRKIAARDIEELVDVPLEIGVGIATGSAYVGNVQSVDRKIWCVIGNTTNLAAHLQAMTRDLSCSIVIDDTTYDRAGLSARDFETRSDAKVRGHDESMTIHLLPRAGGAAS